MSLAAKLKELRIKHGESLQQVADAVGASKAYIWTLESWTPQSGKEPPNPTVELLKKLADHFQVSVSSLLGETPSEQEDQLLRMFRNLGELSESDRNIIEDVIRSMRQRRPES